MKTYIILTTTGMIATLAKNKNKAYKNVISNGFKANKGQVIISSCHIDYVSCDKI